MFQLGSWWYNSYFGFPLGVFFAEYKDTIVKTEKRRIYNCRV